MGLRHWKQRFEADADLIFSKRMKLGCCGVDVVNPGDPVTAEMKEALGRNRLRRWWEAKRVELARFDGDQGRVLSRDEEAEREQLRQRIANAKAEEAIERISGTPVELSDQLEEDVESEDDDLVILQDDDTAEVTLQPDPDADTADAEQPPELPF